ncbi:frataxin domain-containing protein [Holospora elegans]|nr:frataxin domain-containing protein [Holospora elegans]
MDSSFMFAEFAQILLDEIFSRIHAFESILSWDVNERSGVLEVKIPAVPSVYLIHQHNILEQIWLSSPLSGGWHFTFDASSNTWHDTRKKYPFFLMLFSEFKPHIPKSLWRDSLLKEQKVSV